ncbi:hypothetical protein NLU13_2079 [Sarocladium strictum]|uniref:Apple domain-containing protein n=1 Tax=Sarocladium strictum TaxID=5046 RepID=A0AA39LD42_SARSR|nr:hypothetical protein NLU13_2079 [Sarocladium strictum]
MQISAALLALLPLLATVDASSSSPVVKCRTELGTKSVAKVPTTTVTSTTSKRPTQTLVVQSTITTLVGFDYTRTKLATTTKTVTDRTVTDTFHSTSTVYAVQTITVPSTITTTSTSTSTTSSVSTTTVTTAAGFENIQDTLNTDALQRRGLNHPHARRPAKVTSVKKASKTSAKPQGVLASPYPTQVACTKVVPNTNTQTSYSTLRAVTETMPYWSKTVTQTKWLASTSTVVPADVSVTETSTFTSSVTTYTTTFQTETDYASTTTTSVLPGPTVYDACNPSNFFGPDFTNDGQPYYAVNVANNGPGVSSDFQIVADGASTALDCCNACQQLSTCENFLFRPRNRNCFLLYHAGATCPSQANHPNFILSRSGYDTGAGYTVGNGNCGFAYSGNSDGTIFPVDAFSP